MRYLPLTKNDREEMLSTIGVDNIDELFSNIAEKVSINPKFNLPNHKTEMEVEKHLSLLSDKNLRTKKNPHPGLQVPPGKGQVVYQGLRK